MKNTSMLKKLIILIITLVVISLVIKFSTIAEAQERFGIQDVLTGGSYWLNATGKPPTGKLFSYNLDQRQDAFDSWDTTLQAFGWKVGQTFTIGRAAVGKISIY